jgi:hypothetical protein
MAWGIRDRGAEPGSIITVEMGGAHDHPHLPSEDILADLKANLARYEVDTYVEVIEGVSGDDAVATTVKSLLGQRTPGLFVLDSNGLVAEDLVCYDAHLANDCIIAIDDYGAGAHVKDDYTKPAIDHLVGVGCLVCDGVYGWGTWFGRRTKRSLPQDLDRFFYKNLQKEQRQDPS